MRGLSSSLICAVTLLTLVSTALGQTGITWVNNMVDFSINESLPFGQKVYTLRAVYTGTSDSTGINYGFNNKGTNDFTISSTSNFFKVDPVTGVVETYGNVLNYESETSRQFKEFLIARTLEVEGFKASKFIATVTVNNINDEKPVFINGSMTVQIAENTDPGANGLLLLNGVYVEDVDGIIENPRGFLECYVQHCIIDGKIVDCRNDFELRQTGVLSTKRYTGDFYVKRQLNFENASKIQVQLLASDGRSANNVNTDIVVNVQDVQDLPPYWTILPVISKTKDETQPRNLNVTVQALDQDVRVRRPIYYAIPPGQVHQPSGIPISRVYEIDPRSGQITNKITLDLEDTTTFKDPVSRVVYTEWSMDVMACEIIQQTPLVVGTTLGQDCIRSTIKIQIEDINDNRPKFNRPDSTYIYYLPENAQNGRVLDNPAIIITDDDYIYNQFRSELVSTSREFELIGMDRNPAVTVKNTALIDYDTGPRQYTLQMRTLDVEDPTLSSIATIIINILDVNDLRPIFSPLQYNATVVEDAPEATSVIRIQAMDNDTGMFGTQGIVYSLSGPYNEKFMIDRLTGLVTVAFCATPGTAPCIDYDSVVKKYDLTVIAQDSQGQSNSRQGSAPLVIHVTDVNDNEPLIGDYERDIIEDQIFFQPNLTVQATDADEGAVLRFSIVSQTPNPYFVIDPITGLIKVNKPNGAGIKFQDGDDKGSGVRFILEIQVTDGKYTDHGTVKIRIIDTNDNKPTFLPDYYEKSINETTTGDIYILTVTATDNDDPTSANGQIEYTIRTGNQGKFDINPITGHLTTAPGATFNYDDVRRYEMTIEAKDKGQPQQTGIATVVINILDQNNKNPEIDPFLQSFDVYENAFLNQYVGTIKATDPDKGAVLRFQFTDKKTASSDEGYVVDYNFYDFRYLFRVNEDGQILVNGSLDSRRTSIVSYGVTVRDIAAPTLQEGPGTIVINIKPFNRNPPVFENFTTPLSVPEEMPIGSVILSLIARDDVDAIREYKITQQPFHPAGYFLISPNTGAVSIFRRVDYDDDRRINGSFFVVEVADTGDPSLTATATVSVIFTNINDLFPEFMDPVTQFPTNLYTATIPENSPDGTAIVTVYAFDKDRPDSNGFHLVRYYMDDDRFTVNEMTGAITVRLRNGAVLDREQNPRILTQVIARDNPNGSPLNRRQRAATVQVILTDVNDNPPKFSSNEYRITIFETIGVETEILQLFTSDLDLNNNAVSYFSKVQGPGTDYEDLFDVKRIRGRVYVKKSLIHKVGQYWFYAEAQDLLGTGFKTNATIIIDVKPSANSPPVWVIPPVDNMTINVLEEQYNGMLIYDISARDLDTGVNGVVDYSFIYEGQVTQATPEFKINKVTGVIQAEIVYDRERINRYVLLLRASDRGETPLETTRFLTINIIDVNDHAPRFAESEIEFQVLENAPVGTTVGTVTATDLDLNPVILYKFLSGNEQGVFVLNENTGRITLASRLDRESKGVYYLSIQASNDEPNYAVIRSRRATDPSIINVKVIIGDANDLAPVFLESRYYGCISTRSPYDKHILTVQAIDRDAVGTGIVRYSLLNGNRNDGNEELFGIHERFGVVTNKMLMALYANRVFSLTVNARDGENMNTSESSTITALVFVTRPGNEVKLSITQNTAEVRLYQSQIQNIIEKAPELKYVCITDVQDHVVDTAGSTTALWSDVYISGIAENGNNGYRFLGATELKNIITRQKEQYKSDYDLLYIKEVEESSSSDEIVMRDSAVLIILIIIAILIFLIIIFCIIAFLCIRESKRQKKKLLVHKTNMTPALMVEAEPEPVLYDNRAYISEPEPQHLVIDDRQEHIENEPVHVQYAVVTKKHPYENYRPPSPEVGDENIIVVGLDDGQVMEEPAVYEPEYRIETEVDEDNRM